MKQQFYVYGDKSILKDIRIKRYITAEQSDTGIDVVHTIFDGKELHAYYARDISSYMLINYGNKLFLLDIVKDFERVSGFENSISDIYIIKYNEYIYVYREDRELSTKEKRSENIKVTIANAPIDNNISKYTKLVSYKNLNYSEYSVPKEKLEEVFFSDISSK